MKHIPIRYKCKRLKDVHKLIPLKEFAKRHNITVSGCRYWIRIKKVKGFKTGGKWYVYDREFKQGKLTVGYR